MEKITYTNALGDSLTFDYTGEYILTDFTGMAAADVSPATTAGYKQHGETLNDVVLGIRVMTLNILLYGNRYEKKRNLDRLFNPLYGEGTLIYTNDYQSKMIKCIATVPPQITKREGCLFIAEVELTAHNPFFYDVAENAMKMDDFTGGLKFPWAAPYIKFAQKGDVSHITNTGDYLTPVRAEFRGDAINPCLTLDTTGEYIKVATTLDVGEKLWINTEYGNKTVQKEAANGTLTSAYNLIDIHSSFFSLPVGESKLSFSSDGGQPEVYLYWRNRYLGV